MLLLFLLRRLLLLLLACKSLGAEIGRSQILASAESSEAGTAHVHQLALVDHGQQVTRGVDQPGACNACRMEIHCIGAAGRGTQAKRAS
jgi:hypothetical protein